VPPGLSIIDIMRALQVNEYGGPEKLVVADAPVPEPQAGEVLVRVELAGINFIDVYMREGIYKDSPTYGAPLPITLGMEAAGVVEELGPDVDGMEPGQRVAYCLSRGSYADFACVPAWRLAPVPDDVPLDIAAALMLLECTAHYLSHSAFPLSAGDTCLIHSGAGGVGQLLIQLAKLRGATVITTVGNEQKAEIATLLGADHVLVYRQVDFAPAVLELTDGAGVRAVYDAVGKATFDGSLACLGVRGCCVLYGGSSGMVQSVSPSTLAESGSVFLTRPHLAHYLRDVNEVRERTGTLFSAYKSGQLRIETVVAGSLERTADVHRRLEARLTTGKQLVAVGRVC